MDEAKNILKSRTFWFGVIWTVIQFAGLVGFGDYKPPADLVDLVNQVGGLVVIILRIVTTGPVKLPWKS